MVSKRINFMHDVYRIIYILSYKYNKGTFRYIAGMRDESKSTMSECMRVQRTRRVCMFNLDTHPRYIYVICVTSLTSVQAGACMLMPLGTFCFARVLYRRGNQFDSYNVMLRNEQIDINQQYYRRARNRWLMNDLEGQKQSSI